MQPDWWRPVFAATKSVHMTESDWLTTTTRPAEMLRHVRAKASARKLQLISCGCARLVSPLLSERQVETLSLVERYADGLCEPGEYIAARDECLQPLLDLQAGAEMFTVSLRWLDAMQLMQAVMTDRVTEGAERAIQYAINAIRRWNYLQDVQHQFPKDISGRLCDLFREVIGNPFVERVVVGPGWERSGGVVAGWMTRVGETARLIAAGVQAEQAFDRLPILADALEDDGCTDAELLAHLRGPGPHVRGCWAVDVVLGKG